MESKHFSHDHGLVFHQMPQGSEIHCSGCKTSGSGNIYACWQCNHFLHEQCFHATRSLNHPSHTLHPLTLVPYPTYPSGSFFCNSCNLFGNGLSYTCSECQFDMHVHCALMPNLNSQLFPFPVLNDAHNYNPHLHNPIYPPIYDSHFPNYPPPLDAENFSHQSQNTTYPPNENNHFPDFSPSFLQPNAPPLNYSPLVSTPSYTNPPTTQPASTIPIPTYSTVVNFTTITDPSPSPSPPPPPPPPPSYPTLVQSPPNNNPQSKIIKHFSHSHVLKSMEIDQKLGKICSACECTLFGSGFLCTEPHCTFTLHKTCFDSPLEVRHKSHLSHPLKLVTAPPYSDGFTCNACLKDGKAFAYTCATCSYDLHVDCISRPDTVTRPDHEHTLTLYYSSPAAQTIQEATFICDACRNPVHDMAWIYYCRECDFGTHLECVASEVKQESAEISVSGGGKSEEELIREMELKFAMFQILAAQGRI